MTRLPLLRDDQVGPPELVAAIRARRGGELLELDRLLLLSTPIATGWGELMGRIRTALSIEPRLRELAMCGVAVLNGAEYEMFHHAPLFLQEGGTPEQVAALRTLKTEPATALAAFDATAQAVLALTREMTVQVQVSDATFAEAREAMGSDAKLFELIMVISSYNMVSRILVALKLEP